MKWKGAEREGGSEKRVCADITPPPPCAAGMVGEEHEHKHEHVGEERTKRRVDKWMKGGSESVQSSVSGR